jgi:TPR repeat protein/transglutaminase-like putative cysteine protease
MRLPIFVLLAAVSCLTIPAAQSAPAPKPERLDASFSRGAPLPKWAQALAGIPPTSRTDPVVTRLAEVQAQVGAAPATLVNQAIQVNDQESLSDIGQYAISYFPSYQKLQLHRVAIIRGGQVVDRTATVNVRLLERETGVEAGVYGGEKSVQLLLDDVRAGDTLWITYTTEGQNPVFGRRWAKDFSWDRGSPVELRRLTVLHPARQPLYWRQLGDAKAGAITPVIDRIGDIERMRFEGRAIEAVQPEPSIPAEFFAARVIQMSEYPDWQAVAGWADGLFPRAPASAAVKKLAATFAAEATPLAQASAALHWVQNEIRYFSVSIGQNSHRPQAPETVLARRYGDCKDKSYLLVSLLTQLGIRARPVLVNASAPKVPGKLVASPTWFDHAIVRIDLDGAAYYVDPTRTGQKGLLGGLPAALPGGMALVVGADTTQPVALAEDNDQFPLLEYIENIAIASFDGDATLESRLVYRGAYAGWARRRFPSMSANALKKELLARYEKGYPGVLLAKAPQLVDDGADGRYEVVAHYTLPKPVTLKDGRYLIEYDSQIMEDTIGVPAKVVRSFPFRLPQGKFRGRYRLNILWPALVRVNDTPVSKSVDNPFFFVREEYTLRGNYLSYMLDYRLKSDQVAAADMPALSVQAKLLNPFASGRWRVEEGALALPTALGYSFRNFETVVDAQVMVEQGGRLGKLKESAMDMAELCEFAQRAGQFAELGEPGAVDALSLMPATLALAEKTPGARRCRARLLFAKGQYAESVPLFQAESALKDDDALTPMLAWARFYAGDGKGALADMARYRAARASAGELTGFDVANAIALLQRLAQPVPAELLAYAGEVPDGPWPRPLVAMQAGALGEAGVLAAAAVLPADARELALNDAWFFIGQRRLAAGDKAGAAQAFRWFRANGVRGTREYWQAKQELALLEPQDADYQAGAAAAARKDFAIAVQKWREAAGRGVASAQFGMATAHFRGEGVAQDYSEAMRWSRLAAQQGHAAAINLVGSMVLDGLGVPKDSAAALDWHRRAAELGNEHALLNLATYYLEGAEPARRDPVKAFDYFRQSAELGNTYAEAQLGGMYATGDGATADASQALYWAGRASRQGNTEGHRRLAALYLDGKGVPQDLERAATLLRTAADAGNLSAMVQLAMLLEQGAGKDAGLAVTWLEKAAQRGHLIAQLLLGRHYMDGKGVAADAGKAVMWMEKSGAGGYPLAYSYLGEMFMDGIGVPKDAARAGAYFRQGAEQGDRHSQQSYAMTLHFGLGVGKDYAAAAEWYRKAAAQQMEVATNNLADLYENGFGVPQDYGTAVGLYRQAAGTGLPIAFLSLGKLYQDGRGVPASPQLAYSYYQLAINAKLDPKRAAEIAERRDVMAGQLNAKQRADADAIVAAWKRGKPLPDEAAR